MKFISKVIQNNLVESLSVEVKESNDASVKKVKRENISVNLPLKTEIDTSRLTKTPNGKLGKSFERIKKVKIGYLG